MNKYTDYSNFPDANEKSDSTEQNTVNLFNDSRIKATSAILPDINKLKRFFNDIEKNFTELLIKYIGREVTFESFNIVEINKSQIKDSLSDNDFIYFLSSENLGGKIFFIFKEDFISLVIDAFYGSTIPKTTSRQSKSLSVGEKSTLNEVSLLLTKIINNKLSNLHKPKLHYKSSFSAGQLFAETSLPNSMYKIEFQLTIGDSVATMHFLMPHKTYDIIQEILNKSVDSELAAIDPLWSNSLQKEIKSTDVSIQAYISLGSISLTTLSNLKVGQNLSLPYNAFNRINIATSKKLLYVGSLGRVEKNYSVKIDHLIGHEN